MTPADSAGRLLLGTGLGLLLAGGFGLISGIISIEEPSLGFLIPISGIIAIAVSIPTRKGEGPLAAWFPSEDEVAMATRVENDLKLQIHEDEVGNAWAKLEHSMLSKELEQE